MFHVASERHRMNQLSRALKSQPLYSDDKVWRTIQFSLKRIKREILKRLVFARSSWKFSSRQLRARSLPGLIVDEADPDNILQPFLMQIPRYVILRDSVPDLEHPIFQLKYGNNAHDQRPKDDVS